MVRGTNWLGDTVMSLPAYREIRRSHPDVRVVAAVRPSVAGMYRWIPEVDEVMVYQHPAGIPRWKAFWRFSRELRSKEPDVFICFQNAFEAALLGKFSGAPQRLGYARDGRGFLLTRGIQTPLELARYHQVFHYLHLLYSAGISEVSYLESSDFKPDMQLKRTPEMRRVARDWFDKLKIQETEPVIGIHAGAYYGTAKRWLPERYAELIKRLRAEFNATILLFGSQGEMDMAEEIISKYSGAGVLNLCGRTTLEELVALIGHCHLFISNDSGPMHVAAAFQMPQIAIFGSTDPVATGPFSSQSITVKKPVECSPCFLRECPIDLRCFKAISVDEIFGLVKDVIYSEYSSEE